MQKSTTPGKHCVAKFMDGINKSNKNVYIICISLLISTFLLLSCGNNLVPAASEKETAIIPLEKTGIQPESGWEVTWNNPIIKAKKEGKVTVYGPPGTEIGRSLTTGFQNRFNIALDWVALPGATLYPKVSSERKAGLYLIDAQVGGGTTMLTRMKPDGMLEPIESVLTLPEVLDASAWVGGKLPFLDKGHLVLKFTSFVTENIVVNTRLVAPGELTSLRDLLDPKWKGKIVINDVTQPGTALKWFGVVGTVIMDYDYMRQLARQEPIVSRDKRLQVDWLANGKVAIAIAPDTTSITEFKQAGAPIKEVSMKEGTHTAGGYGNVALMNRAPHPEAARVFINWLLSKEGQTLFARAYNSPSLRLDVPTEGIEPTKFMDPKAKYFMGGDDEDFILGEPERARMAMEIFGPLLK